MHPTAAGAEAERAAGERRMLTDKENPMSLIVVLDSNIWLGEQMLRHSAGSAVRFFLRANGAQVAVPEVVRREVTHHLSQSLKNLSLGMRESYDRLLRMVGSLKELVLPSDGELDAFALSAFENARIDAIDVPFTLESARASLEKCLLGEPPSGPKDQQFKDGVLWADCLRLAAEHPVLLVTADKGFYRGRDYDQGLAENLLAEARATAYGITVVHKLSLVLETIHVDVTVDYERLGAQLLQIGQPRINDWIGQHGFVVSRLAAGEHKLFATDDPAWAYLEFALTFGCVHPDGRKGTLVARGEARYSPATGTAKDLQSRGEDFEFDDSEGRRKAMRAVVGAGSIVLGHRTVQHDLKVPLT